MKKVKLVYITNDSKRKTTSKKRKNGLIKKLDEISTLCGIEACAIIYNPNDPQSEVWPSDLGIQSLLSRFRRIPELQKSKKMFDQESFLRQSIIKAQEQPKKQKNENRKHEMTHLMFHYLTIGKIFNNPNLIDLNYLSWLIDQNLNEIEKKINRILTQEVTPVIENGGDRESIYKSCSRAREQHERHAKTLVHGIYYGSAGDEMLPFGDVNAQNDLWPSPYVP